MKILIVIAALAALGGCAVAPPAPAYYGNRAYAQPGDPSQWRVVSVTPVAPGTGARVAGSSGSGSQVEYTSRPITVTQPVYVPTPVYVAPPVYVQEPAYYYPPVSLSLGFVFGRHWSRGHGHFGGRHHFRGGRWR